MVTRLALDCFSSICFMRRDTTPSVYKIGWLVVQEARKLYLLIVFKILPVGRFLGVWEFWQKSSKFGVQGFQWALKDN